MFEDKDWPTLEDALNAFLRADIQFLEKLASESDFPHGVDPWGERRWLSNAIATGNAISVDWVLNKGVEVTYLDDEDFTALKTALQLEIDCKIWVYEKLGASEASTLTNKMIDMLVKAGADVNQRLSLNYTALHAAAAWSSVEVVRHLLSHGADPFAVSSDYDGGRPVDDAKELRRWDVHSALCEVMGLSPSGHAI